MGNELVAKEIKEEDLKLSVVEIQLGTLETNAIAIRDKVKETLKKYDADNYNEDNIERAKKDKALLNNTSKYLNDERIKLEKQFLKPFEEKFKDIITETTTMIKEASSKIDVIVKEVEIKAKATRRSAIETIFNGLVGELESIITLDKVFDEKWLNKGSFNDKGEFKYTQQLKDKLNKIRNDLESISALNSKHELALKSYYLKEFDLGQVIAENNRLNELESKQVTIEEKKEEIKESKIEEMINKPVETEAIDPIKTYTLKITAPLSKQQALKQFLEINKMTTVNLETGKTIVGE